MDIQYASPQTRLFLIENEVTLRFIANKQTGGRDFCEEKKQGKTHLLREASSKDGLFTTDG